MRLSDVEGQDDAVRALRLSLSREEISHAYLFAGPANVGKMTAALAFAAALNCTDRGTEGDACSRCATCRRIDAGTYPDVHVISPDGNQTKIDQMREMIRSLRFAPLEGRRIVVVIEQADTLNPHSENAILKILEEPPSYVTLILLSRNPASLLPTIRSRCRFIRFTLTPRQRIREALMNRLGVSEEQAAVIAAYSQGAVGLAYRMASDPDALRERRAVLEIVSGWADSPSVLAMKHAELLRAIAEPSKDNDDERTRVRNLQRLLDYALSWYSDLVSLKVRGTDAPISNPDLADTLRAQAERYSVRRLHAGIRSIMDTRRFLEGNVTAQLALENMFFDLRPEAGS